MALKVERRGGPNTTDSMAANKPALCHTCKQRKPGLFTTDVYGNPQCADCARAQNRPID